MEDWQIEHIVKNGPKLYKSTKSSIILLAGLRAKALITDEEEQRILALGQNHGSIRASNELYSILLTKTNSYGGLIEELELNRQTGALRILQNGLQIYAKSPENLEYQVDQFLNLQIKLFGETRHIKDALPTFTRTDAEHVLHSSDVKKELFNMTSKEIPYVDLDMCLSDSNELYIPRMMSNRLKLDVHVFRQKCLDIFVFKGITRTTLARLVDPHVTRSSTSQRANITCRHIALDDDVDWDDLVLVADRPMHLVYEEENSYYLLKSTKVTDIIVQRSANAHKDKNAYISEDELIERITPNTNFKGVLLCDIPGMGKTWLMQSLARKVRNVARDALVFFIELSSFSSQLGQLRKLPMRGTELEYLLEQVYRSKLATIILIEHLKTAIMDKILFLDGFDEIRHDYVNRTTAFLKNLTDYNHVRVVISSRPCMRNHLEQAFNVISYDILPFDRQEQVRAIASWWSQKQPLMDVKLLSDFALKCIESIKHIQQPGGQDLLGVPLKCYILSVINEKYALQLLKSTHSKDITINHVGAVRSICDLYEMFVDSSIQKMKETQSQDCTDDWNNEIMRFHVEKAVELLFPEIAPIICSADSKYMDMDPTPSIEELVRVGIVWSNDNVTFNFVHRSFAEYFAGKFFSNFWKEMNTFTPAAAESVGLYFLDNILGAVVDHCTISMADIHFSAQNLRNLQTKKSTVQFTWATVLWFMNNISRNTMEMETDNYVRSLGFFKGIVTSRRRLTTNLMRFAKKLVGFHQMNECQNIIQKRIYGILLACNDQSLTFVLKLYIQIVKLFFEQMDIIKIIRIPCDVENAKMPYMLCRMALGGYPEAVHEIFDLFTSSSTNFLLELCQSYPQLYLSPVEVAIARNDMDMFVYFLDKVQLSRDRLILCGLFGDTLTAEQIKTRHTIYECIVEADQRCDWNEVIRDIGNILQISTHSDQTKMLWVNFLFKHRISLRGLSQSNKCILIQEVIKNMSETNCQTVIMEVFVILFAKQDNDIWEYLEGTDSSFVVHNSNNKTASNYTADNILNSLDLQHAIETCSGLDLSECLDGFYYVDGIETLRLFTSVCPDVSICNSHKLSYLHLATVNGKADWVEYLVKTGHDVNQRDGTKKTPIIRIDLKQRVKITNILIENGANVYAVDEFNSNTAYHALCSVTSGDTESLAGACEWVSYMLARGYHRLWDVKEKSGLEAFLMLVKVAGFSHAITRSVFEHSLYSTNVKYFSKDIKCKLLESSLSNDTDEDFISLLMQLVGRKGATSQQLENRQTQFFSDPTFQTTSCNSQILLPSLDTKTAKALFHKVELDYTCRCPFKNMKSLNTLKLLLSICPSIINCFEPRKKNYLHYSVTLGRLEWMEYLIDAGHNVHQRDFMDNTPLLCLSIIKPVEVTRTLVENGADIYAVNEDNKNVAHIILSEFEREGRNADKTDLYNWVSFTVKQGYHQLWKGIDIHGHTPLQSIGDTTEIIQISMRVIGNLDQMPLSKRTLLENAICQQTDDEIIHFLKNIFPVNDNEDSSDTDPTRALSNNFHDKTLCKVTEILQSLDICEAYETFQELELELSTAFKNIQDASTLDLLIHICPDFRACNSEKRNYLHVAVQNGKIDWVLYLINAGADIHQRDAYGNTPLMLVSTTNIVEITKILLENGADAYSVNKSRMNIVHQLLDTRYGDDDSLLEWVTFMLDGGYHLLWKMRDHKYEQTPLEILTDLESNVVRDTVLTWFQNNEDHSSFEISPISIEHKRVIIEEAFHNFSDDQLVHVLIVLFQKQGTEPMRQTSQLHCSLTLHEILPYTINNWFNVKEATDVCSQIYLGGNAGLHNIFKLATLKLLMSIVPDLADHNKGKFSFMHLAVNHGRIDWVKHLINEGHDVNQESGIGMSPLHFATQRKTLKITKILLEAGADAYAVNQGLQNVAHRQFEVIKNDRLEDIYEWTVYMRMRGYEKLWDMTDEEGNTPFEVLQRNALTFCTENTISNPKLLLFLLNKDFHMNCHKHLYEERHSLNSTITLVYECSISLNHLLFETKCQLLRAAVCQYTDDELVQLLMILFPQYSETSSCPVHTSALSEPNEFASEDVLRLLNLSEAKQCFLELNLEADALNLVFKNIHNLETLKLFERINPDFTVANKEKLNYLHFAALRSNICWMKYLINAGYDVNQEDKDGCPVIHSIHAKHAVMTMSLLIKNGADVYAVDKLKFNVAHHVIGTCKTENLNDVLEWVIYMLKKRYNQVWNMRDTLQSSLKTPLDMLSEIFGATATATKAVKLQLQHQHGCIKERLAENSERNHLCTIMMCLLLEQAIKCYDDNRFRALVLDLFRNCDHSHCRHTIIHTTVENDNILVQTTKPESNFQTDTFFECMDLNLAKEVFSQLNTGSRTCFENIHELDSLKILLTISPSLSQNTASGRNYMHFAVEHGRTDWVDHLIKSGFDVNETDLNGDTPLLCLSFRNMVKITRLLVKNGANVYALNLQNQNVAHKLIGHFYHKNRDNFCSFYEWILYTLRKRFHNIWHVKNNHGQIPLNWLEYYTKQMTT